MQETLSYLQEADFKLYCFPELNSSCIKNPHNVATQTVLYFILVFAMTITILGNSVVIISIAHFKQLHTPTNILVMSLALVDLLLGITVMPFSMIRSVDGCWYYGEVLCFLHTSFDACLSGASIFHLVSIAIDRYQAVCYPLQYPTRVTKPVAWLMVAVSWTAATVYAYSFLLTEPSIDSELPNCLGSCNVVMNALWATLSIVICFFLPCCVMVCLYGTIFFISKKHTRRIKEKNIILNKFPQRVKHESKAVKTLGIVVGAFNFCWMPYFLTTLLNPFIDSATPFLFYDFFVWLGYINSTLNPIIYRFFYPWFRKTLYLIATLKIFAPRSSEIKVYT